jgi:4-hydroxy-3-polyprenylbenzoate decarboxylase
MTDPSQAPQSPLPGLPDAAPTAAAVEAAAAMVAGRTLPTPANAAPPPIEVLEDRTRGRGFPPPQPSTMVPVDAPPEPPVATPADPYSGQHAGPSIPETTTTMAPPPAPASRVADPYGSTPPPPIPSDLPTIPTIPPVPPVPAAAVDTEVPTIPPVPSPDQMSSQQPAPPMPPPPPATPAPAGPPPTAGPPPSVRPTGPPPGVATGGPPLGAPAAEAPATPPEPFQGPYDSVRDYLAAIEATGNLLRIPEMDQDEYETTAFCYRLMERIGYWKAPAFLVERIKIDGRWVDGPLLGNAYGPWAAEALAIGVPPSQVTADHEQMYRRALDAVDQRLGYGIPKIPPVEVDRSSAPVKEVVSTGDEIDLTQFAFIQTNPADAGRYITTGSVIMQDPELGKNVGTYRCQLKGPRQIGVNPEPGQDGWRMLMAAKKRGDRVMKCSIVIGAEPLLFTTSSTKLGGPGQDELAQAGGLKGRPVSVVRSEHSDILVPATAEMVIEGEIPLDQVLPEGPFAELYGYLGMQKDENFFMNVTAVTHRVRPIIVNAYTGIARAYCTAPVEAAQRARLKMSVPGVINVHILLQALGVFIVQIDKTKVGQGLSAGLAVSASSGLAKVTIVVDKDVNIYSMEAIMATFGSRWQPHPGTVVVPQAEGVPLDPSAPTRGLTSKIVIDATRQLPGEGGPAFNAPVTRELMMELAPDAFPRIDAQWDDLINRR